MIIVNMDVKWYRWQSQPCFLNGSWKCPSLYPPMPTEYYESKKISVELTLLFQCLSIIESSVIIIKTSILHLTQSLFSFDLSTLEQQFSDLDGDEENAGTGGYQKPLFCLISALSQG